MITQTFGAMLYSPESECLKEFPSPEELKYRIIISTKPPKERREKKGINNGKDISAKGKISTEDVLGKEPPDLTANQADDERVSCEIHFIFLFTGYHFFGCFTDLILCTCRVIMIQVNTINVTKITLKPVIVQLVHQER